MNKEALIKVADAIQTFDLVLEDKKGRTYQMSFDMGDWGAISGRAMSDHASCGTSACIAGWTVALMDPVTFLSYLGVQYDPDGRTYTIKERATELLDLTEGEANALFVPENFSMPHINRNLDVVPDALRWMALNGEIDWAAAMDAVGAPQDEEEYLEESEDDDSGY